MAKYGNALNYPTSAESVDGWLDAISLPQCKPAFKGMSVAELCKLDNATLLERVPAAGHRKRIVLALQTLSAAQPVVSVEEKPKYNSTSSLYIDSTIVTPCTGEIIFSVSIVIHDRVEEGENANKGEDEDPANLGLFDVRKKPLLPNLPNDFSEESIYQVINTIYSVAAFSSECLVISLLYIERLRANTGIQLRLSTWQPILLAAMIVAQKVWDDRSLLNVDFTIICTTYTVRDINLIEKKFLELLEYNVSVTASMYASYYFELRTLCEKKERAFTLKPLTEDARRRLESRSMSIKQELENNRRWQSTSY